MAWRAIAVFPAVAYGAKPPRRAHHVAVSSRAAWPGEEEEEARRRRSEAAAGVYVCRAGRAAPRPRRLVARRSLPTACPKKKKKKKPGPGQKKREEEETRLPGRTLPAAAFAFAPAAVPGGPTACPAPLLAGSRIPAARLPVLYACPTSSMPVPPRPARPGGLWRRPRRRPRARAVYAARLCGGGLPPGFLRVIVLSSGSSKAGCVSGGTCSRDLGLLRSLTAPPRWFVASHRTAFPGLWNRAPSRRAFAPERKVTLFRHFSAGGSRIHDAGTRRPPARCWQLLKPSCCGHMAVFSSASQVLRSMAFPGASVDVVSRHLALYGPGEGAPTPVSLGGQHRNQLPPTVRHCSETWRPVSGGAQLKHLRRSAVEKPASNCIWKRFWYLSVFARLSHGAGRSGLMLELAATRNQKAFLP